MTSTQNKMLRYVTIRLKWKTGLSVCGALGKLENIVVETFVILDVSSNVSQFAHAPVETLLRKQNLLSEKQKCFLANSETFDVSLCFSLMFPIVFAHSWKHGETLVGNNVSATMFPSLPRAAARTDRVEVFLKAHTDRTRFDNATRIFSF
jgi:hypothetical protein